jgi:Domain of unknown function (DUF4936)
VTRQLFIYWNTPAARVTQARAAAEQMQAQLRALRPGLLAGLYRRINVRDDVMTMMETYALPHADVDEALQAQIAQAAQVLAHWCAGGRHVEVFEELR